MNEWHHNCNVASGLLLIPAGEQCDRCGMDGPAIPAARVEPIPGGVAKPQGLTVLNGLEILERMGYEADHLATAGTFLMVMGERGMWVIANPLLPSLPSSTPGLDPKEQSSEEAPCSTFDACEGGHPLWCMKHGCKGGLDPIRSSDGEELEPVRKPQDPYGY